jgi:hypothetical protein
MQDISPVALQPPFSIPSRPMFFALTIIPPADVSRSDNSFIQHNECSLRKGTCVVSHIRIAQRSIEHDTTRSLVVVYCKWVAGFQLVTRSNTGAHNVVFPCDNIAHLLECKELCTKFHTCGAEAEDHECGVVPDELLLENPTSLALRCCCQLQTNRKASLIACSPIFCCPNLESLEMICGNNQFRSQVL